MGERGSGVRRAARGARARGREGDTEAREGIFLQAGDGSARAKLSPSYVRTSFSHAWW